MTIQPYDPLPPTRAEDELVQGPVGWVARLRAAAELAGYVADTEFVPEAMRNRPEAITAAILYGWEVGLEPMQSLAKIAVIKGRPSLTAEAQRAMILAAGHEIWFEESTATRAIAAGRRMGSDRVARITWTMDDAKRAGVAGQPAYRFYPAEMLRARASAALARAIFADVIGGLAAAEEEAELPDDGGVEVPADARPQSPQSAGKTRRRPTKKPEPTPNRPAVGPPASPQPDPPVKEPLATDAMRRRIFAAMRDAGVREDREARLELLSAIVGRELASTNALTMNDASVVLEHLEGLRARRNEQEVQQALVDEGAEPIEGGDAS